MDSNRKAFLDMISLSEGTAGLGDRGYNVIVGGQLFTDYSDHPDVAVWIKQISKYSTAAGRYQLLHRWWIAYKTQLKLPDFSPASQDAVAIQQIRECGALQDIDAGLFAAAVHKCTRIWASLPGAGYGQHENKLNYLQSAYVDAGGKLTVL